ncbi:hypothetical protein CRG98_041886 [Punica granatum]|uniref:Pseudouridine synthase RsuA/RluA-like domain-containing protein n=1 Tax=Punica granatum TaxID=22663 RepID=A0A2I0I193_PUNGR|nr:hypothetical protein CRG98_041886 [Punica granatum]
MSLPDHHRHHQQGQPISASAPEAPNNYPVPLSPPLPAVSKPIELARAMSASSRSSLFVLERDRVVHEDEWLIAVNKPPGIYCESVLASVSRFVGDSGESAKAGGVWSNSAPPELHLANRLDRDTSGVMLITKSHRVASKLVKAFTEHKVKKTYIALCVGVVPKWEKITVRSGHGRSKFGAWRVYAASDVGRSLPGGSLVRDMETSLEVLCVNGKKRLSKISNQVNIEEDMIVVEEKALVGDGASGEKDEVLMRASPRSGRTHQIRLHCQYLGIPIRGDVKYKGVYEWEGKVYDFHALHAESLSIDHPETGERIMFRAPLPSWASQDLEL